MNVDALARFLAVIILIVGFALGRDAIDWHLDRAEVVELVALDDGTALVTQRGDAGSFISRIRADGSRLWIVAVPGTVVADSIGANRRGVAVFYNDGDELGIATYAPDGAPRWAHVLAREHLAIPGRARPVFAGDVVIATWFENELHRTGLAAPDGTIRWDRTTDVDGMSGIGADFVPVIRNALGEFSIDPRSGDLVERTACPRSPDGSRVVACGWYRSSMAMLLEEQRGTTLALLDREGHMKDSQQLPRVRAPGFEVTGGIPPARIAFSGTLPRYVPLVVESGARHQAILVDMEDLSVVVRGDPGARVEVLRDGDHAYVLTDRSSLSVFDPATHELVPVTRISRLVDVTAIGGGYVWTYGPGTLAEPNVRATPALPRRV